MRFARWLTLVLFGFVSLLGQGLHLLDCRCTQHLVGLSTTATATAADGLCSVCCQCHAAQTAADDEPGVHSANGHHHGDDCLICRFFAQGQLAACDAPPLSSQFAAPHPSLLADDPPFLAVLGPYQARGPPIVSLVG